MTPDDILKMSVKDLLDHISNGVIATVKDQKIATLELEIERLVKARERADEDAKLEIATARRRANVVQLAEGTATADLLEERRKAARVTEALKASERDLESARSILRQSEQSRMLTVAQLSEMEVTYKAVIKQYGRLTQLADDAMRSLQNDDKQGAMGCLREALSDVLNDIESALAAGDKRV